MYQEEYKRWLEADLEDADLKPELSKIEGNDEEIKDRFAVALKFGNSRTSRCTWSRNQPYEYLCSTSGNTGTCKLGKNTGRKQTVAISYDSRLRVMYLQKQQQAFWLQMESKFRIYDALMPVPALSFATRYYNCNAGIMVTASHNPAKYNGYKAYGPDGCQMTDDAAAIVYAEIQKTDSDRCEIYVICRRCRRRTDPFCRR